MQTITKEFEVYQFSELSEEAKEKAVQYNAENNSDTFWQECAIDELKEAAKFLGIDIDKIYYSGFSSQGDGACFIGDYNYKRGALKSIINEFPKWEELHTIAKDLQELQKVAFYNLSARVKHSGHYYHEYCTSIEVFYRDEYLTEKTEHYEEELSVILRDFMRLCYSHLESCYEYEISEKNFLDYLEPNEYLFLENGDYYNE